MKSNCTVVRLEDIATDLSDGLHKAPVFVKGGEYIFVNATNLENGHIVDKLFHRWDNRKYRPLSW